MRSPGASEADLDRAMSLTVPELAERHQRMAIAVWQLLLTGHRPTTVEVAAATRDDLERVGHRLRRWPGVEVDGEGRVLGFWGVTAEVTPHRMKWGGRWSSTWGAWDALVLSQVMGPVQVRTSDPANGAAIGYRVDGHGMVRELTHPHAVLSFPEPRHTMRDDLRNGFCGSMWFFTDTASAEGWAATHGPVSLLGWEEALLLARRQVRRSFGDALRWPGR